MLAADAAFPATGRKVAPSAAAANAIVIAAVTVVAVVAFTARLGGAVRVAALVFDVLVRLMGFRLLVSGVSLTLTTLRFQAAILKRLQARLRRGVMPVLKTRGKGPVKGRGKGPGKKARARRPGP
jgi:hypothetical protein